MKEYKELVIFACKTCADKKCIGEATCERKRIIKPPKYFSGEYINARNKLIPVAEAFANKVIKSTKDDAGKAAWNRAFHAKMNALAESL